MIVLVTGASGFVGAALVNHFRATNMAVRSVFRSVESIGHTALQAPRVALVPTLDADTDWSAALSGVQAVVHCAARVHVMAEAASDPLAAFRIVNVQGTLNLARQAAAAGVRRFVFISSVKVNGERSTPGRPYYADDVPAPKDAYGISKAEAEDGLRALAEMTGMELVIVRPPLVYGPGVKGNFASMLRWVGRGVPLPLAAITNNQRSLVALDNLVDLIATCVQHPRASGQIFLVSDGEDISTAGLLRRIAQANGRVARLVWVPAGWLGLAGRLMGKGAAVQRLLGSLQVDIAKTRELLGWEPPIGLDEGLRRATKGF